MEKHTLIFRYIAFLIFGLGITSSTFAQRSLYRDQKAMQEGDILTVILQENISGKTSSDAKNTSNASAGAGGSTSGNIMPFQPTFGSEVQVNYDSGEQISTNQGQLLEGYMSVEVMKVTQSGNLVVEGARSTEINGEKHSIQLTGMVRPKDVNSQNQVFSYRLANAKINYKKEEGIKRLTKKEGFLKKAALTVAGIAISAVAVLKAMN